MLKMKPGCRISHPELLNEEFERRKDRLKANVNFNKLLGLAAAFLEENDGLFYFVLELPTAACDEPRDVDGEILSLHNDVYYLDGLDKSFALNILEEDGELLINDGMSGFGFGLNFSHDEIFFEKYNIVQIFSDAPEKHVRLMERLGIPETAKLATAWDTFTQDEPGECRLILTGGRSVYSLREKFAPYGLYFVERRDR